MTLNQLLFFNYIDVGEVKAIVCFFCTEKLLFFSQFHLDVDVMVCYVDICHHLLSIKLCGPHSYTRRKCVLRKIILGKFLTDWIRIFPPVINSVEVTPLKHVYVYKIFPSCKKNNTR